MTQGVLFGHNNPFTTYPPWLSLFMLHTICIHLFSYIQGFKGTVHLLSTTPGQVKRSKPHNWWSEDRKRPKLRFRLVILLPNCRECWRGSHITRVVHRTNKRLSCHFLRRWRKQGLGKAMYPDFYDYMGNMEIKKQKNYKWSGRSTKRSKHDIKRTHSQSDKKWLGHDAFHKRQQEDNMKTCSTVPLGWWAPHHVWFQDRSYRWTLLTGCGRAAPA